MNRTIVAVNAHPDDEVLLMAGTLAKAAAHGDRVVLVTATDGGLGLAGDEFHAGAGLGARRMVELQCSADALGAARVEWLGYADSGSDPEVLPDPPGATRFVNAPVEEAAAKVTEILREENADLVIGYDPAGGYGHRDHVRVHQVARAAAAATGTRLLEATIPRELVTGAIDLVSKVYRFPPEFNRSSFDRAFTPRAQITHTVTFPTHVRAKRAAMRAHASQATSDDGGDRTLGALLWIPRPLYDVVLGREWFVDPAVNFPAPHRSRFGRRARGRARSIWENPA